MSNDAEAQIKRLQDFLDTLDLTALQSETPVEGAIRVIAELLGLAADLKDKLDEARRQHCKQLAANSIFPAREWAAQEWGVVEAGRLFPAEEAVNGEEKP